MGSPPEVEDGTWVLLDSGSCLNAYPPSYATGVAIQPLNTQIRAKAVNGQFLQVYGKKLARLQLNQGYTLDVCFVAMDMQRPLISVGDLRRRGFQVKLGRMSALGQDGVELPLKESAAAGLFYLEGIPVVKNIKGKLTANLEWANEVATTTCVRAKKAPLHFVEWCCEPDSRLGTWFANQGCSITRLHLPHDDMRLRANADKVLHEIQEHTRMGGDVVLWAAVPCTA